MKTRKKGPPVGIGVDIGGTFTKIVAVTPCGRVLREFQIRTLLEEGPRRFVRELVIEVRRLIREFGGAASVGVGIAGDVDATQGRLRFAPNLRAFTGFNFKSALESLLSLPVLTDNDANMAAWGGYVLELGRKPSHAVCLTLGTGIGGGIIVDGRLHHGATGTAGEIGHTCVEPDGERCHCGAHGCLEAYASAYGIVRIARKLWPTNGRKSILRKLCPDPGRLDTKILAKAAQRGDPSARAAWQVAGHYLGLGIANVVYVLNPDAVLIVGGVAAAGPLLLGPIRKVLRGRPFRGPFQKVHVKIARTPHLGAMGAALRGLEAADGASTPDKNSKQKSL